MHLARGGITQLVECLLCKQDAAGSNPATSTTGPPGGGKPRKHRFDRSLKTDELEVEENCNVTR